MEDCIFCARARLAVLAENELAFANRESGMSPTVSS